MKEATGLFKKFTALRGAGKPQITTPETRKESFIDKPNLVQGKLAGLPDEVLIAILCEGLEPRDLIAVSHVCQALYACASLRIVWRLAWPRATERLAPLEPPPLVLPAAKWFKTTKIQEDLTLCPTTIEPIEWRSAYDSERSKLLQRSYRARYLEVLRVKHQLRQEKIIMEPLAWLHDNSKFNDRSGDALTPGGEVLVYWHQRTLIMFDLRSGIKYTGLTLCSGWPESQFSPWSENIVAQIFIHEGTEGLLIVAPFLNSNQLDVVFQPFSASLSEDPRPLKHLGNFPVYGKVSRTALKGRYLIYSNKAANGSEYYRIVDLCTGLVTSVNHPLFAAGVEVYNDEFIFFHNSFGTMFVAQLSALNADPELSPPPQVWLELLDFPTFTKIWYCTSARAHLDPILQQPVLFMWALDHLHGLPHQMHLVRMGVPLIDRSEGLIIPNGNVLATSYTTPFTEDLFKNEAHNGRWGSGGTSPEELDERMRVFANYYSSHKPPHTNCTTGNSVPLSNIAREGRETTRSGFTTVLSRLDESGQRIVHKPLHICTRAQTWKGKLGGKGTSAKVEQFTEWASSRDYTLWDEISGRLVVHNRDWVTGKVSFTIYQL